MAGVSRRSSSWSSSLRTRLEWTVPTTYGLRQASFGECQRSARADNLGSKHVVVQHLRRPLLEQIEDGGEGRAILRLVDDVDGLARRAQPADGWPVAQADDLDVEAPLVESLNQVLDVKLARRHHRRWPAAR